MPHNITVGSKLYSYCYGPMTVVSLANGIITAEPDDVAGMAAEIQQRYAHTKSLNFYEEAVGHWIFTDPGDVGTENDDFPHRCQPSNKIELKDEFYHAYYGKDNSKEGPSPVGSKPGEGPSPVGSKSAGEGPSPVGSKPGSEGPSPVGSKPVTEGPSPVGSKK